MIQSKEFYDRLGISYDALTELSQKYGLSRIAVFGSFARGEDRENSDIDLLAEWPEGELTFSRYMGLIEDMENETGRKVDLATPDALHWYIKDKILSDAEDLI